MKGVNVMGEYSVLPTVIVGLIIAAIVVFAIVSVVKQRKKGGCSCGCEGCSSSSACGTKPSKTKL